MDRCARADAQPAPCLSTPRSYGRMALRVVNASVQAHDTGAWCWAQSIVGLGMGGAVLGHLVDLTTAVDCIAPPSTRVLVDRSRHSMVRMEFCHPSLYGTKRAHLEIWPITYPAMDSTMASRHTPWVPAASLHDKGKCLSTPLASHLDTYDLGV